jgi:hypothetical protein
VTQKKTNKRADSERTLRLFYRRSAITEVP